IPDDDYEMQVYANGDFSGTTSPKRSISVATGEESPYSQHPEVYSITAKRIGKATAIYNMSSISANYKSQARGAVQYTVFDLDYRMEPLTTICTFGAIATETRLGIDVKVRALSEAGAILDEHSVKADFYAGVPNRFSFEIEETGPVDISRVEIYIGGEIRVWTDWVDLRLESGVEAKYYTGGGVEAKTGVSTSLFKPDIQVCSEAGGGMGAGLGAGPYGGATLSFNIPFTGDPNAGGSVSTSTNFNFSVKAIAGLGIGVSVPWNGSPISVSFGLSVGTDADVSFAVTQNVCKKKDLTPPGGNPNIDHPDDNYSFSNALVVPAPTVDALRTLAAAKGLSNLLSYCDYLDLKYSLLAELGNWPRDTKLPDDIAAAIMSALYEIDTLAAELRTRRLAIIGEMRQVIRTNILSAGFWMGCSNMIAELTHLPVDLIDIDEMPYGDLLVIPSGGLVGLDNSTEFRMKLAEFASNGGAILCFDQQHGSDYRILPGGSLDGYGWSEETSCFSASLYLSEYHQVLSGFTAQTLDSSVDGYFTEMPQGASVLLRRTTTGQPEMVMYPYGDGIVFAICSYDDWSGMWSWDTETLVRDTVFWCQLAEDLPEFRSPDVPNIEVPAVNNTAVTATRLHLLIIDPYWNIIEEQDYNVQIGPGASVSVNWTPESWTSLYVPKGIWHAHYQLFDAQGSLVQPEAFAMNFVVSDPPESLTAPELAVNATYPSEKYLHNTYAPITVHVYNNSDISRHVRVDYSDSGNVTSSQELDVPAQGEASFGYEYLVVRTGTLMLQLYENDEFVTRRAFMLTCVSASAEISIEPDKMSYVLGDPVSAEIELVNTCGAEFTCTVQASVIAPNGNTWGTNTDELTVPAGGSASSSVTGSIPVGGPSGTGSIRVRLLHGGETMKVKSEAIIIADSPLSFMSSIPATLNPGQTAA
ncbi:MAG: hypothetical protein JW941_12030, partial [Candidatus Coatesbacteria bacterium]|nr:hypothetical protein [Candidatus Coatesbacteria bacterium]